MARTTAPTAALKSVRASLASNPGRTVWTALSRANLTRDEAQAVANVLSALSGHAVYLSGRAALSLVDRALAPVVAPSAPVYGPERDACEVGELAEEDYLVAMAAPVLRTVELASAAAERVARAATPGEATWALLTEIDLAQAEGCRDARVPAQLLWLLALEGQLHTAQSLLGAFRAQVGADDASVVAAGRVLRQLAGRLDRVAQGLDNPGTASVRRRLARTVAA